MVVELGVSRLEVAAELGITAGTVRVHLRRAKINLASESRSLTKVPQPRASGTAAAPLRADQFPHVDTSPSCLAQLPTRRRQVVRQYLAGASVADISHATRSRDRGLPGPPIPGLGPGATPRVGCRALSGRQSPR
jgi:hypothetical protein